MFKGVSVFGSRLEYGLKQFRPTLDVLTGVKNCQNPTIFSAMLSIDSALGNEDRHWMNWLPQVIDSADPNGKIMLRVMDFSRAWPATACSSSFHFADRHRTSESFLEWPSYGVVYKEAISREACQIISKLDNEWLTDLLKPLPESWKTVDGADKMVGWWASNWKKRVQETEKFLAGGAWK